jgi:hypothetical protein
MIKDEKQRISRKGIQLQYPIRSNNPTGRFTRTRRNIFRAAFKPVRKGVSQQVLDVADQVIKEYQSDLDYLKDK